MTTIVVHGGIHITLLDPNQIGHHLMSELSDVIQAQVAEDSIVVTLLDKWQAQANAGGNISADELAADIATLSGEHDKLVAAVANDSTFIPGSSTTGTGPASAPGSAPADPTVPPAGTTPVTTDPVTGAGSDPAPVDTTPADPAPSDPDVGVIPSDPVVDAPATPDAPAADPGLPASDAPAS